MEGSGNFKHFQSRVLNEKAMMGYLKYLFFTSLSMVLKLLDKVKSNLQFYIH